MKRLQILFSLNSLAVVLVSIERFSFTTRVLLQPYNFLRLHELIQITVLILATVIIPFFLFKEVTGDFSLLSKGKKSNMLLGVVFIAGIYFYASGNAFHELASFLFNQYCDVNRVSGQLCGSLFFNDYYTGNVLYFIGAFLFTLALILLEVSQPRIVMTKRDIWLLLPNCLIYALAIVAYAGFDRVLVGLVYSLLTTLVVIAILFIYRKQALRLPITDYTALTYVIGTLVACLVRFHQGFHKVLAIGTKKRNMAGNAMPLLYAVDFMQLWALLVRVEGVQSGLSRHFFDRVAHDVQNDKPDELAAVIQSFLQATIHSY